MAIYRNNINITGSQIHLMTVTLKTCISK